ncbi:MAG TPA: TonB-dependent receptor, partial [Verrucomicrobiae bacterium]|nr:TonB-dependent receptor [Verrucomicrobiae bacterium]
GTLPNGLPLNRIPLAPDYTASANVEYRWPIENLGDFTFTGEYLMRGESYLTVDNNEDGRVEPYGLLNARISFEPPQENWRISLWGENLTDEVYKTRLFDLYGQDLVGQRFIVLGDPQTYGIELRVSY